CVGGDSVGDTPGPIPNPEAKPYSADGTAPGTVWESRTLPNTNLITRVGSVGLSPTDPTRVFVLCRRSRTYLAGVPDPRRTGVGETGWRAGTSVMDAGQRSARVPTGRSWAEPAGQSTDHRRCGRCGTRRDVGSVAPARRWTADAGGRRIPRTAGDAHGARPHDERTPSDHGVTH